MHWKYNSSTSTRKMTIRKMSTQMLAHVRHDSLIVVTPKLFLRARDIDSSFVSKTKYVQHWWTKMPPRAYISNVLRNPMKKCFATKLFETGWKTTNCVKWWHFIAHHGPALQVYLHMFNINTNTQMTRPNLTQRVEQQKLAVLVQQIEAKRGVRRKLAGCY